jgi:membrane protease YdiL (CAAX protease family)
MLFPAFVALSLEVFAIKESRLYFRNYQEKPRQVIWAFLLLTLLIGAVSFLVLSVGMADSISGGISNLLFVLWTLLLIRLYQSCGEESFRRAGLQLGDTDRGVRFVVGVVIFFLLQAGLNWLFKLGDFQGLRENIAGIPVPETIYPFALTGYFLLTITGTPLGGLAVTFGEEYGWRGFLQRELYPLGSRWAVFLVGLVWAVWHIPIIRSGVHTYPPTPMGFTFSIIFFILWGFVQSYAVIKTGSIWTAAFLHGVVNGVYAFTITFLVRPENKLFSFGLGGYGLLMLAAIVLFILRDPIWGESALPVEKTDFKEHNQ